MMIKRFSIYFLLFSIILSCSKDDSIDDFDNNIRPPEYSYEVIKEDSLTIYKNIYYADISSRNALDIYIPSKIGVSKLPVIIYFHGGGFQGGSKDMDSFVPKIKKYAKEGYIFVSAEYRVLNEAIWPAQINDAMAVVRWVKANAENHQMDTSRICVMGASAGASLAALIGTAAGNPFLEGQVGDNNHVNSRVDAVIVLSGVYDFTTLHQDCINQGIPNSEQVLLKNEELFGCDGIYDCYDDAFRASAYYYVDATDAVFYIAQSDDEQVPVVQSTKFYQALSTYGKNNFLSVNPGDAHGNPLASIYFDEIMSFLENNI